jgi:PAS domain S-box-containing protein
MIPLTEAHGAVPPRLEQWLEVVPDGVLALDDAGRPLYVNAGAERILGQGRQALLGRCLWELLPALEHSEFGRACQRARASRVPSTVEEYLDALGAWVEARVHPTPSGLLVLLRDVTPLNQVATEYASLHALVASAPAVAFVTRGPQHVFVLSNARHRHWHGEREVLGRGAGEVLRPGQGQGLLEVLDRVYGTGEPLVLEQMPLAVEAPGGQLEERLFHLTCQPLPGAGGRVDGVTVFAFDVTEWVRARWRAERLAEELSLSEVRFRSLVVATSTLLWTTDATGCFREDSPTWCAFTGQSYESWRNGSGWWEAIHPEDRARAAAAWQRAFSTRGLFEAEYRLHRADGTYTPVVSRGVPVLELDGSVREWVGSITDITAPRRARQTLEVLTEASTALASTWEFSQALERLTRCVVPRLAEWCGVFLREESGALERVAFSDVDPVRALHLRKVGAGAPVPLLLEPVLAHGRAQLLPALTEEALALEPDAARREVRRAFVGLRTLVVPIRVKGQLRGGLVLLAGEGYRPHDADDIQLAEELAHRVAIALEHVRLFELARQERDRAEQANRAKDAFLATVSHELRTPLTAILGWTNILRTTPLPPEKQARALETVERSARAQAQIVDDLLDISRIVAGRMRLEVKPVEFGAVVEGVLDVVRPAAAARDIRLETRLEGDTLVLGDAQRLQQVVWNLLTNALKFTPPGGQVTVRLMRRGAQVELEVSDSGQGIAPEFLPHLFERFQQADGSTTRRHGGLGLGLSIVRHLVELQGGTVQAHSEGEGQGSRFSVSLPVVLTRAPPPRPVLTPDVPPRPEGRPDLSGVRVLVVDDELDTREILRTLLEESRAEVTCVASCAEALELLARAPPDLLVSDIGMPEEDGYSFIRRVRALPAERGGRVPAAALTAYTRPEDREQALGAGFQVHVPKPVDATQLMRTLASMIAATG